MAILEGLYMCKAATLYPHFHLRRQTELTTLCGEQVTYHLKISVVLWGHDWVALTFCKRCTWIQRTAKS
jgi:hypothetical protein